MSRNDLGHLSEIVQATMGVIFLGTPHHGSHMASLGKVAFNISKVFFQNPNTDILRGLERNSEILERITVGVLVLDLEPGLMLQHLPKI